MTRANKADKIALTLGELLDMVEPEDIQWAIEYLEKRYDSWQDYLSMPST